jgi:crotonobetainyl-CoA:carnitine CoA-transferase CaiB-like acyl-CoA transferase
MLGEHTDTLLARLGLARETIASMRATGVIV